MKSRRSSVPSPAPGFVVPYAPVVGAPAGDSEGPPASFAGTLRPPTPLGAASRAAAGQADEAAKGGSSLSTSLLNLSKNIIGAGMLSLPFAVKSAGVLPFVVGIIAIGLLNAYTFFLLGWCCRKAGSSSFGELWSKTFGQESAWIADASVLLNNGMACLAYCVLIGDFLTNSFAGLLPAVTLLHNRGLDLALVAGTTLVPLCMLRDLAPLRFSSIAGLAAVLYGFFLLVGDCATSADISGPLSPVRTNFFPMRVDFWQAVALFSSAFMAHYNSPKFYADLQDNTLPRFGQLVLGSFGLALGVFIVFGFCGFALFGYGVNGNVLTNYGGGARVMLAWLGMAFSVVFTFPLVFSTFRDSFFSILVRAGIVKDPSNTSFRTWFTIVAVAVAALGGTVFNNVAVVNGVKGAVLSACLAFIYPAIIHLRLTEGEKDKDGTTSLMRSGSMALIVLGAGFGVLGLLAMFVLPKTAFSQMPVAVTPFGASNGLR